jgi:hypothetical protein
MYIFLVCIIPGNGWRLSGVRIPTVVDANHHGTETANQEPYNRLALLRLEDELVLEVFLPDHSA